MATTPSIVATSMIQLDLLASAASFCLILYLYVKRSGIQRLPLPPGPKKIPVIGNLLNMPTSFGWKTYHKWCKELSVSSRSYTSMRSLIYMTLLDTDILHLNVFGASIIILDTPEVATELLERRSSIYSGRYVIVRLAQMPLTCLFVLDLGCQWLMS
jgi:hypothetical protein